MCTTCRAILRTAVRDAARDDRRPLTADRRGANRASSVVVHPRATGHRGAMSTPFRKAAYKLKKIAANAVPSSSWNIYRGDRVVVNAGKDRGESGIVARVDREKSMVYVNGLNVVKKHVRGRGNEPGRVVSVESGLHYSKVSLADPVSGAAVRVGRMFLDDGTKVRVSRGRLASGSVIPMPQEAKTRRSVRATGTGPADTPAKVLKQETRVSGGGDLFQGLIRGPSAFDDLRREE